MKHAAFVITIAALLSTPAQSQSDVRTLDTWTKMNKAVFDWAEIPSSATEEERTILQKLWAKELAARHMKPSGYLPGFALIGEVREGSKRIVFTMFSAGGVDSCDPAANGASASDIYEVCRLRVARWPQSAQPVDLPDYCMIAGTSDAEGWVEYRYDKSAQSVQFRTIQFGQVVPSCSRTLKLG